MHASHNWPFRHHTTCSRIRLFRASQQNMRECLEPGNHFTLIVPNVDVFFFLRLSLLFFINVVVQQKLTVGTWVRCYYGVALCILLCRPLHFHFASHYSANKGRYQVAGFFTSLQFRNQTFQVELSFFNFFHSSRSCYHASHSNKSVHGSSSHPRLLYEYTRSSAVPMRYRYLLKQPGLVNTWVRWKFSWQLIRLIYSSKLDINARVPLTFHNYKESVLSGSFWSLVWLAFLLIFYTFSLLLYEVLVLNKKF